MAIVCVVLLSNSKIRSTKSNDPISLDSDSDSDGVHQVSPRAAATKRATSSASTPVNMGEKLVLKVRSNGDQTADVTIYSVSFVVVWRGCASSSSLTLCVCCRTRRLTSCTATFATCWACRATPCT